MMNMGHEEKTKKLAARVTDFYERQKPFYVFHGSTNSTRILNFKQDELVDLSVFTQVLSVDAKQRTAIVEPNVPMDALVRETLKYGLVPGVVMEFPGITVGGGIQGNGGESGSFKHGAFNQLFNWYELVLANGDIVKVSKDEQSDLFYALPGTAGSLAVLASAEIRLVPAKKYVQLDYIPVQSFAEAKDTMERVQSDDIDFLDGIMFAKDSGVIIVGSFSDKVVGKKPRFSRATDQWYYLHVQDEFARQAEGWTESVPLTDYLFRYDRGAFWVGRFAFEMFDVPYNRFMRWLMDPIFYTRKL
jgi:FAD/FMN-containing dehydrogenase